MTVLKKEGLHLPIQAQTSCWAPEGLTPTPLESYSVAQADLTGDSLAPAPSLLGLHATTLLVLNNENKTKKTGPQFAEVPSSKL